jgi:hypothetical protein
VIAIRSGGYRGRGRRPIGGGGGGDLDLVCPEDKPDLQASLCYKKCAEGYHGVGPVCWKNHGIGSYGRGVGISPIF